MTANGVANRLDSALLAGAGAVLAFTTLALGGTPPWARAGWELGVVALLGVCWLTGLLRGELSFRLPRIFSPMLAIFLLACVQSFGRLSVYPPASREQVWGLLGVGGFFFLLCQQLDSEEKSERFARWLLAAAFLVAVFAVLQRLSFGGKMYWHWLAPPGSQPFGPFINRNHYAAWALLLLPLAWAKFARRRQDNDATALWGLVLGALAVSVLLTASRAGVALFLLAFPLYWVLARPRRSARRQLLLVAALIVLAVGVTLALDAARVATRWETLAEAFRGPEELDRHRWQIWHDTVAMIAERPWWGSGVGTYGVLSDSYRSFYSSLVWKHAHNDYLQWVAETGLAGAALALWFLLELGRAAGRKLLALPRGAARQQVAAALTGCLLVLLHSGVDFPLRIPANALLFVTLLAIVTVPVRHDGTSRR